MAGDVDETHPNPAAIGSGEFEVSKSNVDGNATPLFFFEAVGINAGQGFHQRRFAVIDMSGGADDDGLHLRQYRRVRGGHSCPRPLILGCFFVSIPIFQFPESKRQMQRTRASAPHNQSTNSHAKSLWRCDNKDSLMTTSAISVNAITPEMIREHGLTPEEFEKIKQLLGGREPTRTELGIFSVMWSEHCSYKSSRVHLKRLPTRSKLVVQGPGENAGIVDIGDGWACAFKIESHNHPSFIEPFQGAATGVGGILRDIFTMGARPVAVMDSLRFGPIQAADLRPAGQPGAAVPTQELHK